MKIIISENQYKKLLYFIDRVTKNKKFIKEQKDDPTKADLVKNDLSDFYRTLEDSIKKGGLSQQPKGNRTYQKDVESLQIGLVLLGYDLPKHGVDGKFGPETAAAVTKFTQDNVRKNTPLSERKFKINENISKYNPLGNITIEKNVDTSIDVNLQKLINSIQSEFGKPIRITSGYRDPEHNRRIGGAKKSAHLRHNAVDITFNKDKEDTLRFVEIASKLGAGGIGVYRPGVVHIDLEGRRSWGPNFSSSSIPKWARPTIERHLSNDFNANKINSSGQYATDLGTTKTSSGGETISDPTIQTNKDKKYVEATPEMIKVLIKMLKSKNITADNIKSYTDNSITTDIKIGGPQAKGDVILKGSFNGTQRKNISLLIDEMNKIGITNPYTQIGILSVIDKESSFEPKGEVSYAGTTNKRIRKVFGKRVANYSDAELDDLKKDSKKFFNVVYAKSVGNQGGDDGWNYRGRGFNQLTGIKNYEKYGRMIGMGDQLVQNPELVNDPKISVKIALAFFTKNKPASSLPNFNDKEDAAIYFADINSGGGASSHRDRALLASKKFDAKSDVA